MSAGTPITLEALESVLFRGFLIAFGFVFIFSIPVLFFADEIYALHSYFFQIPREDWTLMMVGFIADMKLLAFVFMLVPWLAIRWHLGKCCGSGDGS